MFSRYDSARSEGRVRPPTLDLEGASSERNYAKFRYLAPAVLGGVAAVTWPTSVLVWGGLFAGAFTALFMATFACHATSSAGHRLAYESKYSSQEEKTSLMRLELEIGNACGWAEKRTFSPFIVGLITLTLTLLVGKWLIGGVSFPCGVDRGGIQLGYSLQLAHPLDAQSTAGRH